MGNMFYVYSETCDGQKDEWQVVEHVRETLS